MTEKVEVYGPYVVVETRGQGFVGLMTCLRCGAAVLDNATERHNEWHLGQS